MQEFYRGRSPHGERGLKWKDIISVAHAGTSLPTRGAWIEIVMAYASLHSGRVAPHTGSVD